MRVLSDDDIPSSDPAIMNEALAIAVQRFLARAPSKIQMIPIEDAIGLQEQVNIPGTVDEHPNWLQKLPIEVDSLWENHIMQELIQVMNEERN